MVIKLINPFKTRSYKKTANIKQELNAKKKKKKTRISLYCGLIEDKLIDTINMQEPSIADNIVIAHVENELSKLIKFLNQGKY